MLGSYLVNGVTRREWISQTAGAAIGLAIGSTAKPDIQTRDQKIIDDSCNSQITEPEEQELDSLRTRQALLSSLGTAGLMSYGVDLLNRNHLAENKRARAVAVAAGDPRMDNLAHIQVGAEDRRSWIRRVGTMLRTAAILGPGFSVLGTSSEQDRVKDETELTSADFVKLKSELQGTRELKALGIGSLAALLKFGIQKLELDGYDETKLDELRYSVLMARQNIAENQTTGRIKDFAKFGLTKDARQPLDNFLPEELIQNVTEPVLLTIMVYGANSYQVAYYPDDGGDSTNWDGPGIYMRQALAIERDTRGGLLRMPNGDFELTLN